MEQQGVGAYRNTTFYIAEAIVARTSLAEWVGSFVD